MSPVSPNRRRFLLATPCLVLGACSNIIGPLPASQIYVLQPAASAPKGGDKVNWSLAIARPTAPDSLDSNRIALARGGIELDYYANAVWADDLPDLVQTRLLEGFEATGRVEKVGREESGLHADFQLMAEIRHFEARYAAPDTPPAVAITIVAYLMRAKTRDIVSTVNAVASRPCTANSVTAVVEAFDLATAEAVDIVTGWALSLGGTLGATR
jgi:cholesterol transport system auxiliary component